jgi:hypothetical protein
MKRMLLLVTALGILLSACGPAAPSELERNRALWESQGIAHYRFDLSMTCFCGFRDQMPLTIEVQDGQVVTMSAANGGDVGQYRDTYARFDSLGKLFDIIANAEERGAFVLEVTYDPVYGYPASIYLNPNELAVDDEDRYEVTNFQVLP